MDYNEAMVMAALAARQAVTVVHDALTSQRSGDPEVRTEAVRKLQVLTDVMSEAVALARGPG